jgi:hypothetical protein
MNIKMTRLKGAVLNNQSGKRKVPRKISFIFSFSSLIFFGSALFIGGAFLYPKFFDLINLLSSGGSGPLFFYGFGWALTFFCGVMWLCCFLMFEAAKEDLIILIRE